VAAEETREHGHRVDRRALIRRSAVVGTVAWAVPTIESFTPAFGATGTCGVCMTGGGRIEGGTFNGQPMDYLTFGLGKICCGQTGGEIQVTAHGQASFHFTINAVTCTFNGSPAPPPNTANCPNTFTGQATDGNGNTLSYQLQDNGEPGATLDLASFSISGNYSVVATGTLAKGNLQVHDYQKDCSGC
jgi:hypothetical protein